MSEGQVSREDIRLARRTPLAEYLLAHYPSEYENNGRNVVSIRNRSLTFPFGFPGYHSFESGIHGNSIDYLVKYKGLTFVSAVHSLCAFYNSSFRPLGHSTANLFSIPEASRGTVSSLYRYLTTRAIPKPMIDMLIRKELIYEDVRHNVVFINKEHDYCEIYGTGSMDYFRCMKVNESRFWYLPVTGKPVVAYVCSTCMDALSLSILRYGHSSSESAVFVASAGQDIQTVINRLAPKLRVIMAMKKDEQSEACIKRNTQFISIRPKANSWNDDLRKNAQWR